MKVYTVLIPADKVKGTLDWTEKKNYRQVVYMPELSNGEQKRLLDNLTIPTKFFTNKILKKG